MHYCPTVAKVKLEFILLGVLLQRSQTGYELQQFMDTNGRFMRASTSMTQVYRSLRSMEDDGWLTHEVEPRAGAKDAKRYRVADEGRRAFDEWLDEPYDPASRVDEGFKVRLRFRSEFRGRDAVLDLLDAEIAYWERHRALHRHRDRSEFYDVDASIDIELAGALLNWEHLRGVEIVDSHLAAITELREVLGAGDLPATEIANPLIPEERS